MSETITFEGPARAMASLANAFEHGHTDRLGVTDTAHAATWHMAGLIEQLRSMWEDGAEQLRRGELSAGPARPGEEPTT